MIRFNDISIICSSFGNSEIDVIKTLDSLERQSYKNFEVIVVLPAFKNNIRIFNRYKKKLNIKIIITSKKENLAKSLNIAYGISKGRYISRIDFDDTYKREKLFKQYNYMKNNPSTDISGTNTFVKSRFDKMIKINFPERHEKIKKSFYIFNAFCHSSVMINRKKLLTKKKLYNQEFCFAEDLELWLKYLTLNFNYYNIQENLTIVNHNYKILRNIKNYQYNLKARMKYSKKIYGFYIGTINILIFKLFILISNNFNKKFLSKLVFFLKKNI